jgi:GDP-4-dehydro-6-deoxy-D-mannose reductase
MTERALITGGNGFVGTILSSYLCQQGDEVHAPLVDITDLGALRETMLAIEPTIVYHLAALANVGDSWNTGPETYRVNTLGSVNVAESLRALPTCPRLLFVSSADVYGPDAMRTANGLPVNESVPTNPVSPYGGSKRAAEVALAQAHAGWQLPVIIARSFNHVGPGQTDTFVVSALAKQIAEAERTGSSEILVGNLHAERDFLDVSDVVRAYRLLAQRGTLGATYNVASGDAVSIFDVATFLLAASSQPLKLVVDPARFRPVDVPRIVGDATHLQADTGWAPTSNWQTGAHACLEYWREQLSTGENS